MSFSLADMRAAFVGGSKELRFKILLWDMERPGYEEWADLVERAIAHEVGLIAQHRSDLEDLGEDALTAVLVIALQNIGLQARSSRVNGNCDLTVSLDTYLWLGEAKLFTGVTHVWHGYLQLTARYATGMPNQNRGGMLLYCVKDRALALLGEWKGALMEQVPNANARDGDFALQFISDEICESSGLPLLLRHFAFPLFHAPTEDAIKLTKKALSAGRNAKKDAKNRTDVSND